MTVAKKTTVKKTSAPVAAQSLLKPNKILWVAVLGALQAILERSGLSPADRENIAATHLAEIQAFVDSDNDGVEDSADKAPLDPTVQ